MDEQLNKQTITAVLFMTLVYFQTHSMLQPTTRHHQVSTLEMLRDIYVFDIHMSVHRNIITNYSQQDATFLEFISTDALNVSGGSSAHHQEHITLHTASGIVNKYCSIG